MRKFWLCIITVVCLCVMTMLGVFASCDPSEPTSESESEVEITYTYAISVSADNQELFVSADNGVTSATITATLIKTAEGATEGETVDNATFTYSLKVADDGEIVELADNTISVKADAEFAGLSTEVVVVVANEEYEVSKEIAFNVNRRVVKIASLGTIYSLEEVNDISVAGIEGDLESVLFDDDEIDFVIDENGNVSLDYSVFVNAIGEAELTLITSKCVYETSVTVKHYTDIEYRVSHWNPEADDTKNSPEIGGYMSLARVEEDVEIAQGLTINEYNKISITGGVWVAGMMLEVDMDRNFQDITFYTKTNNGAYIGLYSTDGDMIFNRGAADWLTLQRNFSYNKSTYNGWDKIVFTKTELASLVDAKNRILIGISLETIRTTNLDGYVWSISDITYTDVIEKQYRVSYWNGGPWATNTAEISPKATVSTVQKSTAVADGVTINEYDVATITGESVWTIGAYITVDVSKLTDKGVALYIKADPCYFGVFAPNDTFLYPWNAWRTDRPSDAFVKSYDATTGWTLVVIDKSFVSDNNGIILAGFQNRIGAEAENTNWGALPDAFAVCTEFAISSLIYDFEIPEPEVPTTAEWNVTVLVGGNDVTSTLPAELVGGTANIGDVIDVTATANEMLTTNPDLANYELDLENSVLSGTLTAEGLTLTVVYVEKDVEPQPEPETYDKEFRVSYWTEAAWITNNANISSVVTLATVKETTTVAEGVTIDRYDTLTATYGAIWTMGAYINVDLSKLTDNGLALYVKADPCYFGVFAPNDTFIYPWNAWRTDRPSDAFVKSYDATTGWTLVVIDKSFIKDNNGVVLIGFQNRVSAEGDNTTWGSLPATFAESTVVAISSLIYDYVPATEPEIPEVEIS